MSRVPRFVLRRPSLERFRRQLASVDAMPQLCLLGIFAGILTGSVMVVFRLLLQFGAFFFMPGDSPEAFEALPPMFRAILPLIAVTLIGIWLWPQPNRALKMGIGHVIERLAYHQGKMPLRNWVNQWWVGIISVIGGLSAGREGPAIHLGSAASSWIGTRLRLPHNSLRVLVACGTAAGISASFNTPIAGVIFAMEVVLMEYTIASFLPVILASVSGAVVTQLVFGEDPSFSVTPVQMKSLLELPFMALAGAVIALVALVFTRLHLALYRSQQLPILVRFTTIGALTGALALVVPEVMGLGYDTLEAAMLGELGLQVLLAVVLAKTVASAVSTGLGMPGGLIGPILVIGGCVGGVMGNLGEIFYPEHASGAGFYVTLGMAAMMGAVLNAPLAALMAILELTYNPNAIFPSMVVIVVASVFTQQIFGCEGIFRAQLRALGTPLRSVPAQQVLSRAGVLSVMNRSFVITERRLSLIAAHALLEKTPTWIVLDEPDNPAPDSRRSLLRAADLAKYLDSYQPELNEITEEGEAVIDLAEIPGQRYKLYSLHPQANLYEARELLRQSYGEAICIEEVESSTPLRSPVLGIVTPGEIDNYYGPVR